jgi:hypothetical protein
VRNRSCHCETRVGINDRTRKTWMASEDQVYSKSSAPLRGHSKTHDN